jgi:hypothetical protein
MRISGELDEKLTFDVNFRASGLMSKFSIEFIETLT